MTWKKLTYKDMKNEHIANFCKELFILETAGYDVCVSGIIREDQSSYGNGYGSVEVHLYDHLEEKVNVLFDSCYGC